MHCYFEGQLVWLKKHFFHRIAFIVCESGLANLRNRVGQVGGAIKVLLQEVGVGKFGCMKTRGDHGRDTVD